MASKKNSQKNQAGSVPDEQAFSLMFEGHSAVMLLIDPLTGNILDANRAAVVFYGYPRSKLRGMSISEINTLPSEQVMIERQKALNKECNYFIFSHKLASGEKRIVEVHSSPIALDEKQILFSIVHDITDRIQAEEKLVAERNLLGTLLDNLPDRIYVKDKQGRKVISNTADWQGVGVKSAGDVLGKSDLDTYPSELAAKYWIDDRSVLDLGELIISREEPGLDGHGNPLCILTTKVPLMDKNGQVTGLVGIGRDITERKHVEQTLRDNESRFRSLFDDLPISLWEEDFSKVKQRLDDLRAAGVIDFNVYLYLHPEVVTECIALVDVLDVNKATLTLYGSASKEDLVKNLAASLPEAGNDYFRTELGLIASGALHFEMEMIAQTMDGRMITVNLNWAVIPGYESDLSRVIVSIIDITERKRAELELEVLAEIMRGLVIDQDLKDFLGLIHHSIAKVIYAENFFVILYNTETTLFDEVYSVDKYDPPAPPSQLENSISAYVFRTGQPLLLTDALFDEFESQGKLKLVGSKMCSWLGVPLKTSSKTIGVMALQDYDHPNRYSERDTEFLFSIAGQVALAVERKQADEALHRSEERYRTLFDSMMDGIYRSTHAGKFVDVNPAMVKMFGFSSKDEMLAVDIKKDLYFAPEDRGSHVLDTGQKEVDVYRMRRKDGSEIWVEDHGYYVHDQNNDILYHEGMLRDITARKQAEDAVTNSEKRFRALIENGRDNISLLAADGTLLWESPSIIHTLGYTSNQFVGSNLIELIHPDDQESARKMLIKVNRKPGISHDGVFRLLHGEGSWNWIEATITNLLHEPSVQAIVINYRDITERKQAEDELRRAKETLDIAHQELEKSFAREQQLAHMDELTGVNNRRSLFELAGHEFNVAMRYRPPLSVLMFDIDHFKQINDTFGHAMGDQMLKRITQTICNKLRIVDTIGRYGGDEFVVLLPQTCTQEALHVAERIHASIAAMHIQTDQGPITMTISVGIAQTIHNTPQTDSVENLFLRADKALYAAKQAGRNRTVIFEE